MPTIPNDPSQADPSIIALMQGVVSNEGSGGDPNKLGDKNAQGQYTAAGIGQWSNEVNGVPQALQPGQIPANFVSYAKSLGLDPTDFSLANQNKVLYGTLAADKANGLSPEQALSKWNSGDPNKYLSAQASSPTGPVGAYNVANYVKNGMAVAQKYAQSQQSANGDPPTALAAGNTGNTQSPSLLQKAGGVASTVGNFLFPIVGDIGGDINGTNQKTALQQTGDAALSVLPFIPGLGEVGEGARGAELATEGAADVAPSLLAKLAGSTITKGAATGYGAGVASNLSQGQGLGQAFDPNINTIGGTVLGGAAPVVLKGASALVKGVSGVSDQIVNALRDSGISTDEYNQYINGAKVRAGDIRAPAPLEMAANQLDKASGKINQNLSQAGQVVGAAKTALGGTPIPDVAPIAKSFGTRVQQFGVQLVQDATGAVKAIPIPGRTPSVSPAEISRIQDIAQSLVGLQGSTAQNATDVISKIDNSINYAKAANGSGFDPIEGLLHSVRSDLDDHVRSVAPDLAAANDRFSQLSGLKSEIQKMAGGNMQQGELLMKRVFSGDKSGDVQNLFGKIKDETGIDLVKHAVLAKHAIDVAGDSSQKSLLGQMIEGGASIAKGPLAALLHLGQTVAQKTVANPETIGREAVKGTSGLLKNILNKGGTKAAIEASRFPQSVLGFNSGTQQ